jgi:hypothetical protein
LTAASTRFGSAVHTKDLGSAFVSATKRLIRLRQALLDQAQTGTPTTYKELADRLGFEPPQAIHRLGLLTRLSEGQHATVLQLPASPRATNEAEQQKRGSLATTRARQ